VLLEQNAIPGKANRYLSRWASLVICGLPQASGAFPSRLRVEVLGNPVRPSIVHPPTPPDPATFGLDPDKHTLLVLGGSQGAHNVNEAVVHLLADLDAYAQQWQVVHQTGSADRDDVAGAYARTSLTHHVAAFIDDMPSAYALADLMVGRAGATTLAELACTGTPAVFLPLPWAAEDHQTCNAQVYVDAGAGLIVPDRRDPALTGPDLCRAVEPLLSRAERLDPMRASALRLARPHAADLAADAILDLLPG